MIQPILAAVTLVGLMLGPVQAQGPAPGPAMPEGAAPAAPPTQAERQKNNAAKIAGLVGFVRVHCPDLRPNDERFRSVVAGLGVRFEALEEGDLRLRALSYMEAYAKDIPASCARAEENFGKDGRTLPDLIAKR